MDFIIIILFIILISALMITAYVPYELHSLAKKAGFSKFSLRFLILKLQKIPIKYLFEQYEKIVDNKIDIEFDELKKYWGSNPENFETTVKLIINGGKSNLKITTEDIENFNLSENNSERFFSVLKKINNENLNLSQEKILELVNSDTDIEKYFEIAGQAKEIQLDISQNQLDQNNLQEIELFIKNYIKAEKTGVSKEHKLLNDSKISWKERNLLLNSLILIKQKDIDISDDELSEVYKSGINFYEYIKSVDTAQRNNIPDLDKTEITNHYFKGGDVFRVINAFEFAKANNTQISVNDLLELDLNRDINFDKTIDQAVIPFDLKVNPPVYIVLKDGLQISPNISVSVKKKININSFISYEKNLFYKINEKFSDELLKFKSHTEVLKNLKSISENVLNDLKTEKTESYHKTFEILKIKITDIEIKADKLAEIKDIQAKEKETEAKLNLLKSKKKLNEDMAKALKKGKISFKDYQKEKYIFNTEDENDLPYH
ncbi:MAG: flotillin-like FloA family protein [Bacteroidales bacterium]|nr:flotillin-like FloA family protein [Bacteroidales bacterium]